MAALKELNSRITLHLLFPSLVRMIEILINLKFMSYFKPSINLSMYLKT